jgi:hypothetical protein
VFLKLFRMNEATLMRGRPDGGGRSARGEDALYGRAAVASGGLLFEALGNLRDGCAAATSRALD